MPEMQANQMDINQLLKAVDSELSAGREKGDPTEQKLKVSLDDRDLWCKFKELTNEMIVTKSGRRMFPVMRVAISGLDPNAMYSLALDFIPVESHRWKYVNGDWVPGGKAEPPAPNAIYIHPDSPNFGAHWMKEAVSFSKVKLTNKMHGRGQMMLNSLHKYQPRVHVIKVGNGEKKTIATHSFPETQFVAVTAYQNEEITALKIKYNPFAKAFQDAKERPEGREFSGLDDITESEQKRLSQIASTWFLPTGSHALMPSAAHQFGNPLALSCDRFGLRDHRHSPYSHPFHRRSPPHAAYPHEMNANLSMLNFTDNWAHMSAAAAAHPSSVSQYPGVLTSATPSHQSQYSQYAMWGLSPASQSCSQYPQYLRSTAGYPLPPTPESTPGVVSSSSVGETSASPYTDHSQTAHITSSHASFDAAVSSLTSSLPSNKDTKTSLPAWTPLTPPSI